MSDRKPELRYNIITGDWVVVSPERARRPNGVAHPAEIPGPEYVRDCPFCRGNEEETAAELARIDGPAGWQARVVQNRFPALAGEGSVQRTGNGYARSISGVGHHEVVVESPLHNTTTALMDPARVQDVFRLYRDRMKALYADPRIDHVIIFKNHGESAGSTLDHPHSQIVGTPVVPGGVRFRIEEALRQYGERGECLICYCLRQELAAKVRIVEETERFVVLIPYAALSPYHVWIVPRRHAAYFGAVGDEELEQLATVVQRSLRRIFVGLGNPHFNYVIRSLSPSEQDVKYYHWYLSIIVRVNRAAGFELGTGMYINTALPEESARLLREVDIG